jgi:hypothetical protein
MYASSKAYFPYERYVDLLVAVTGDQLAPLGRPLRLRERLVSESEPLHHVLV